MPSDSVKSFETSAEELINQICDNVKKIVVESLKASLEICLESEAQEKPQKNSNKTTKYVTSEEFFNDFPKKPCKCNQKKSRIAELLEKSSNQPQKKTAQKKIPKRDAKGRFISSK